MLVAFLFLLIFFLVCLPRIYRNAQGLLHSYIAHRIQHGTGKATDSAVATPPKDFIPFIHGSHPQDNTGQLSHSKMSNTSTREFDQSNCNMDHGTTQRTGGSNTPSRSRSRAFSDITVHHNRIHSPMSMITDVHMTSASLDTLPQHHGPQPTAALAHHLSPWLESTPLSDAVVDSIIPPDVVAALQHAAFTIVRASGDLNNNGQYEAYLRLLKENYLLGRQQALLEAQQAHMQLQGSNILLPVQEDIRQVMFTNSTAKY